MPTLPELFEHQVAAAPDAVAVSHGESVLSFASLNARANVVARELIAAGVGPEDMVALVAPRSLEAIIGLLAIMKAGAAYVPIDPAYPADRVRFMLEDANARAAVITGRGGLGLLPQGCRVVVVDSKPTAAADEPNVSDTERICALRPDQPAYAIYTSGSTGLPKAIVIPHSALVLLLNGLRERIYAADRFTRLRITVNGSLSFDTSVKQVVQLADGHALDIVPEEVRVDGPALRAYVAVRQIDVLDCVPSQAQILLNGDPSSAPAAGLRALLIGGDAINQRLWDALQDLSPLRAFNLYGPAECTVDATVCDVHSAGRAPTIGRPLPHVGLHVLDARLEPVASGEAGELYISGGGLGRGYFRKPALTSARFVANPSDVSGARMYRTGDRVRVAPDGALEFLGRTDHQLKVRGVRIEPSEVEAALLQLPGIRSAVVVGRNRGGGGHELIALIVASASNELSEAGVRAALSTSLPPALVPAHVVRVDHIPLTPAGKLDRAAALAQVEAMITGDRVATAVAGTPIEEAIASVWARVLNSGPIGLDDDFFALGGDSLHAMSLLDALRDTLGVQISLKSLFARPTVRGIAEEFLRVQRGDGLQERGPVLRRGATVVPVSSSQARIWLIQQLDPTGRAYAFQARFHFQGRLNAAHLEAALRQVVSRHEIYRTSYGVDDQGSLAARVSAELTAFPFTVVDLTHLSSPDRMAAVMTGAAAEMARPFDTSCLPLIRWTLYRVDAHSHVLSHVAHHLVHDGWSFNRFLDELLESYGARAEGREPSLPALPVQFGDVAAAERDWLASPDAARELDYWKSVLADAPPPVALPADRERPAAFDYRGGAVRWRLKAGLFERAHELARRHAVSGYCVMLTAFVALLTRYGSPRDLCVGVGAANRRRPETHPLIGMFVNTLALRFKLPEGGTTQQWLQCVWRTVRDGYAHQECPLDEVVRAVAPSRTAGQNPLFSLMFNIHHASLVNRAIDDLSIQLFEGINTGAVKFDLNVIVIPGLPSGGTIARENDPCATVNWEYSAALFDRWRIEQMAEHYERILEGMIADAHCPAEAIPLITADERRAIAATGGAPSSPTRSGSLASLFQTQVDQRPDAVAIASGGESLTYAALDARANQLASLLESANARGEAVVGVCLPRSVDLLASIVAAVKTGATYLPLDVRSPAQRLQGIVAEARPTIVVTSRSLAPNFDARTSLLLIDDSATAATMAMAPRHRGNAIVAGADDRAVYVMYTSGSTGVPKGVVVTAAGIKRLVLDPNYVELGSADVIAQLAPAAFDASTFEIWGALLNGGRLVLPLEESPSLDAIGRLLRTHGVTTCWLTSGLFHAMVQERLHDLSGLSQLLAGGDVLDPARVKELVSAYPDLRFINGYGPTEATTFACTHHVHPDDLAGGSVPIGTPIAQTDVYVLDARLDFVPVGIKGELFIAGSGLARAYLGRGRETAAAFVANPHGKPGSRMYRTGDHARWRRDGTLEFLGRADAQLKINGFRVEPGEVERALREDSRVGDAVVVARVAGNRRALFAYATRAADSDGTATGADIRRALAARLPDYMIPSVVEWIDQLPLTANGKVDRTLLPEIDLDRRAVAMPATPEEEVICELFGRVLDVPSVGPEDDFFALGGHSLLATILLSRIRASFDVEIALRALFECPTPRLLAGRLDAKPRTAPRLVPGHRQTTAPVSSSQRRLWFLAQLAPDSAAYNIVTTTWLRGGVNIPALAAAIQAIVNRHESLRTHFVAIDGEPHQVIEPERSIPLVVDDLLSSTWHVSDEGLADALREEGSRPFDLSSGPIMRVRLFRIAADEHVLIRVCHHIATDGWSEAVFNRELSALYDAYCSDAASPLPPLTAQYADFAVWQHELLATGALEEQLAYWRDRLTDPPEQLPLPTDRVRPAQQTFAASVCERTLSADRLAAIKRVSRERSATLYMTMLAAYAALLSRHSGVVDIVIGSPIAGRQDAQLEHLIGFFANTLPLRIHIDPRGSLRELIAAVRDLTLDAHRNQDVPFEHIVEAVAPERSLSHMPLLQVMFTLQNAPSVAPAFSGITAEPFARLAHRVRSDLELHVAEHAGGLSVRWLFNTALFDGWRIERLADHYEGILEALVRDDDQLVGALELLSDADRRLVLGDSSHDGATSTAVVPQLFEHQAAVSPDAVAVCLGDECVTYQVLNERANVVAHRLLATGVGPESIVALAFERSVLMLVAMIGVTKTGAAYLPVEPGAPAARIQFVLGDARPASLLIPEAGTQELALIASSLGISMLRLPDLPDDGNVRNPTDADRPCALVSAHPAYVIYTSGSTGQPKGVSVSHRNLVRLFDVARTACDFGPRDISALFHSYAFDFSVWEIWGALLHGGRLIIVPYLTSRSPRELAALVCREQVTVLNQTPSAFYMLAEAERDDDALLRGHALRTVVFGGETLELSRLVDWYARHGQSPSLVNMYGITETTVHVTAIVVDEQLIADAGLSVIGRALPDLRTYVLDRQLRPSPIGVSGEMYVAGAGVSRGYLNRAALTAQRFVANPFGPGERMYRTGDVARWRRDGNLEFLGRADRQVKLRGFRIELGEIESALRRDPSVRDALVVVAGGADAARLVAYVVGDGTQAPSLVGRLQDDLRLSLPDYMVPSALMVLDRWPLTSNGKIDKEALPLPESRGSADRQEIASPLEEVLCELFASVLGMDGVGVEDDFFQLGGHSLMATRLVSRIRAALGTELPIRVLFEASSPRALSGRLSGGTAARLELAPQLRPAKIPLSHAQQRLWFLDQLGGGSTEYHMPLALRIRGELNVAALRQAVQGIIDRHETLRTRFMEDDGEPLQLVEPQLIASLPVDDWRQLDSTEQARRLKAAFKSEWAQPFDLSTGPLLRARLVRLGDHEHVLIRTMHHLVSDGWSEAVFNQELFTLYDAADRGTPVCLPQLPLQYADFAICQRKMFDAGGLREGLNYWTRQLKELPRLELPTDHPRPPVLSAVARKHYHTINASRLAALESLSQAHQATLHMTMLAAFNLLLNRYTGQQDIAVGVGVANRQDEKLDGLIGFFVNTVVVRTRLTAAMTLNELLAQVRRTTIEAYQYQDVPFDQVVEALAPERSANTVPLVQVVFAMQNAPRVMPRLGDLRIERVLDDSPLTRFDLEVDVFRRDGELTICWLYNAALFDAWRIEQMAAHFDATLDGLVDEYLAATRSSVGVGG